MVSTRGVRYKFSEGERVLCYEPDPTKAKVLYDSKVLEVVESKDKRGRRTVEYLIHFQGWNSSWDRCVSEDFVLKDTEENRQLQRDLADKSQLQLGAYLYRRERKKGGSAPAGSGAGPAKRARHGFSDDGSSSSTQPDATDGNESQCSGPQEAETGSGSESGSGSGSARSPQPRPAAPLPNIGRAQIVLPTALRDRLTFDYHLVVKRGRLSRLPASPCAAHILESFVKWFARAGAWHPRRGRHDPLYKPDLLDVSCRLNLVREVADGLRVYFDFILRGHLLYKAELEQYHTLCGQFIDEQQEQIKSELEDSDSQTYGPSEVGQGEGQGGDPADLKSPKMAEYSHLPPDPDDGEKEDYDASAANNGGDEPMQCDSDRAIKQETGAEETDNTESKPERALPIARGGNVARRLRSHKSCMSESDEPVPSTSAVDPREHMSCSAGSSGSSASDGWCVPNTNESPSPHLRTPLSRLLDKVSKWQIMPSEGTEHLPSRLYGAIHLARLFVKLPDFLNATHMPDYKLKLILKYIDMFVHYMNDHSEWFGEMYYIADNMSRSH